MSDQRLRRAGSGAGLTATVPSGDTEKDRTQQEECREFDEDLGHDIF
jgi:hypothetical protein